MSTPTVVPQIDGPVAVLRLSRPTRHNAFNIAMRDELHALLVAISSASEIRTVVLEGEGANFCAGADLSEFGQTTSLTEARAVKALRDVFLTIRQLPQVTIASLHGHVIGSGLEMALECDLRFAARSTIFRLPETSLGFIPAAGATITLRRAVGLGVALDMILAGAPLSAEQALRAHLISRVHDDESHRAATQAIAVELAQSRRAMLVKQLMSEHSSGPREI